MTRFIRRIWFIPDKGDSFTIVPKVQEVNKNFKIAVRSKRKMDCLNASGLDVS